MKKYILFDGVKYDAAFSDIDCWIKCMYLQINMCKYKYRYIYIYINIKDIDANCNCFIELTLHPISAIDISKVQSCAIPKEYTKHFPSIMS